MSASEPKPLPASPQPRPGISGGLMATLGFVAMAGALSTDLYLPAFPEMAAYFGVEASAVQLTMTAFLTGSAFGQLLIGAVSDALGRRRTLLFALVVFGLCSYAAAAAPSLGMLIAVRAVQGLAGSAGAVLARAVIADLTTREQAVRAFSVLWALISVGPAIASPLGAWLTGIGGWRTALLGLAVLTTGMLVVTALVIPESLPIERRHPFTVRAMARNIGRLLRDPVFVFYAVAFGTAYGTFIVYISSSSFIVQGVFGAEPIGYALTYSLTSVAAILGAWASGRIAHSFGVVPTLRVAQLLIILSAGTGTVLALTGALVIGNYLPIVCVFAIGCSASMSSGSALAIGRATVIAGTGSALAGFSQFLFAAIASPLGGLAGTATAVPAMSFMTVFGVAGLVAASAAGWLLRRNHRTGTEPRRSGAV